MLLRVAIAVAVVSGACGGDSSSPTAPSPSSSTPAPTAVTLTGTVTSSAGTRIGGATVTFIDGPNGGRSAAANANGEYSFGTVAAGNANLVARAPGYVDDARGISLVSGSHTLAFTMQRGAPWTMTGSGNSVFDMPTYVTRVRIRGVWSGSGTSNFIVRVGGRSVVNEILRDFPNRTYEGVHLVTGGVVEITSSGNISSWTFTEER